MKLPNWFRVIWWIFLLGIFSFFFFKRYPDIIVGKSSILDTMALIIWVALALAPIFQEVNLFGVKLKQEIKALKEDIKQQITTFQSEIRSNISNVISPQFNMPLLPPPDSMLPEIEKRITLAVQDAIRQHGFQPATTTPEQISVPDETQYLFAVRYNIEKELRRIWLSRTGDEPSRRFISVSAMIRMLTESELIDPRLASAIKEIYAICSPAIHSEPVTKAQMAFARDVGQQFIAALKAII